MITLYSESYKNMIVESQTPGRGYTDMFSDIGAYPGGSGIGSVTSPGSRVDTYPRERVQNYKTLLEPGMIQEWGKDEGAKPNGTILRKKKTKKKKGKGKKKRKDLGYITEIERITRSNPRLLGRVQKHWRRKNDYSRGKSPYKNDPGAWPHSRPGGVWPKLPSWEPSSYEEQTNRYMML